MISGSIGSGTGLEHIHQTEESRIDDQRMPSRSCELIEMNEVRELPDCVGEVIHRPEYVAWSV